VRPLVLIGLMLVLVYLAAVVGGVLAGWLGWSAPP
jgi:hypothetical protein